jgi:CheY-like chemotaxis protein
MASAKYSLRAGKRDGIEAAALLRDIMDIPVVFLTADGDQEPLNSRQIVAAVDSALTEWDSGLKRTKGWRRNE